MGLTITRWAERAGRVVRWGNLIGSHRGQEYRETFRTVQEARERERQALANEPISRDRPPIALHYEASVVERPNDAASQY